MLLMGRGSFAAALVDPDPAVRLQAAAIMGRIRADDPWKGIAPASEQATYERAVTQELCGVWGRV